MPKKQQGRKKIKDRIFDILSWPAVQLLLMITHYQIAHALYSQYSLIENTYSRLVREQAFDLSSKRVDQRTMLENQMKQSPKQASNEKRDSLIATYNTINKQPKEEIVPLIKRDSLREAANLYWHFAKKNSWVFKVELTLMDRLNQYSMPIKYLFSFVPKLFELVRHCFGHIDALLSLPAQLVLYTLSHLYKEAYFNRLSSYYKHYKKNSQTYKELFNVIKKTEIKDKEASLDQHLNFIKSYLGQTLDFSFLCAVTWSSLKKDLTQEPGLKKLKSIPRVILFIVMMLVYIFDRVWRLTYFIISTVLFLLINLTRFLMALPVIIFNALSDHEIKSRILVEYDFELKDGSRKFLSVLLDSDKVMNYLKQYVKPFIVEEQGYRCVSIRQYPVFIECIQRGKVTLYRVISQSYTDILAEPVKQPKNQNIFYQHAALSFIKKKVPGAPSQLKINVNKGEFVNHYDALILMRFSYDIPRSFNHRQTPADRELPFQDIKRPELNIVDTFNPKEKNNYYFRIDNDNDDDDSPPVPTDNTSEKGLKIDIKIQIPKPAMDFQKGGRSYGHYCSNTPYLYDQYSKTPLAEIGENSEEEYEENRARNSQNEESVSDEESVDSNEKNSDGGSVDSNEQNTVIFDVYKYGVVTPHTEDEEALTF